MTKKIGKKHAESKPMEITPREQAKFETPTRCWICGGGKFNEDNKKVRDHCHFTGKYRGAAHNKCCNLRLKKNKTIPVLFHNGSRYDFHLFVKNLGKVPDDINVIAKNDEQHISIDKKVPVGKKDCWRLRFLDSCGFLQGSLEKLVASLASAGREKL